MAFEEVAGSGNGEFEEREFVSAKIGVTLEGVFQRLSPRIPSKWYDGEYRIIDVDLTDGRKVAIPAGKILLERVESAGLAAGDRIKIEVGSATAKKSGREYALPRVYVDRAGKADEGRRSTAPTQAPKVPLNDPPF